MHRIENCEKVKQNLQPKTTSNDNSVLKEKVCRIKEAIQEIGEKELQYEDGHDL